MDWLKEQERLRDAALREALASPQFSVIIALDRAVEALGGKAVLSNLANALNVDRREAIGTKVAKSEVISKSRAVTTLGTAALRVLEEVGKPLPMVTLLEKVQATGLAMEGKDPLSNFRSSLSRDSRLRSHGKSNVFVWWFADRDLPQGFDEAEPNLLKGLNGSASSVSSLEGGDGHGPATTH